MNSLEQKVLGWLESEDDRELVLDFNMQLKPYDYYGYSEAKRKDFEQVLKHFLYIQSNKLGESEETAFKKPTEGYMFCKCSKIINKGANCLDLTCKNFRLKVECEDNCMLGKFCRNKRIQNKLYKKTVVKDYGDQTYSLKTEEPCENHSFIMEYVGQVTTTEAYVQRTKKYIDKGVVPRFLAISPTVGIDATLMGNLSRFVTHSCDPNCYLQLWLVKGEFRLGIFASRKIGAGEDLTVKYNFSNKEQDDICNCNSRNCKGSLGMDEFEINFKRFKDTIQIYSEHISTEEQSVHFVTQLWFQMKDPETLKVFLEKLKVVKELQTVFLDNYGLLILYNLFQRNKADVSFVERFLDMLLGLNLVTRGELVNHGISDCIEEAYESDHKPNRKLARKVMSKNMALLKPQPQQLPIQGEHKVKSDKVDYYANKHTEEYNPEVYTTTNYNVKVGGNKKMKTNGTPDLPEAYFEDLTPAPAFIDSNPNSMLNYPNLNSNNPFPTREPDHFMHTNFTSAPYNNTNTNVPSFNGGFSFNSTHNGASNFNHNSNGLDNSNFNLDNGVDLPTMLNLNMLPKSNPVNNRGFNFNNLLGESMYPNPTINSFKAPSNSNPFKSQVESIPKFTHANGNGVKEPWEGAGFQFKDPNVSSYGDPSKSSLELELTRLLSVEVAIQLYPKSHHFTRETFDRHLRKLVTSLVDKEKRKTDPENLWTHPTDYIKVRQAKIQEFIKAYFAQTNYSHHFITMD